VISVCGGRLRGFVLLAAVLLAGSLAGPAAAADGKTRPPTALWKAFPLTERPTAADVATYGRALEILTQRTAAAEPTRPTPAERSTLLMVLLTLALALLALAALPDGALRGPRVRHAVVVRRAELVLLGTAVLVPVFLLMALR
jgi:hypothetical protein